MIRGNVARKGNYKEEQRVLGEKVMLHFGGTCMSRMGTNGTAGRISEGRAWDKPHVVRSSIQTSFFSPAAHSPPSLLLLLLLPHVSWYPLTRPLTRSYSTSFRRGTLRSHCAH